MEKPDASPPANPVSIISHRLRTPLTVIMSTVNNLLDGAFGDLKEEQTRWLKKLETHTQTLELLLNDILDLIKSQEGVRSPVPDTLLQEGPMPLARTGDKVSGTGDLTPSAPAVEGKERVPTILIVDDEPDIREIMEEGLGTKGFKTVAASNGEDAVRLALEMRPDLILMDVLLKNQNGMEICRQIKSRLSGFTPVILVTGQDDLREKIAGSHHDADDLLTKPFQMEELFARVTSMLRMKKLHDELERSRNRKGEKKT